MDYSEITSEELKRVIRRVTIGRGGMPVLAGAARREKVKSRGGLASRFRPCANSTVQGVEPLLDAIVDYLPTPLDRPPVEVGHVSLPVIGYSLAQDLIFL